MYHSGRTGYYFGYSVALHKSENRRWLIVGAPLSDAKATRHGAVYMCDLTLKTRNCKILREFDSDRSSILSRLQHSRPGLNSQNFDYAAGQWLGATVRSSRSHVMACAPRFAWSGENGDKSRRLKRYIPAGKCEVVDFSNVSKPWVWKPCSSYIFQQKIAQTRNNNRSTIGFCSLGFDANFNSDGDGVVSGAPSSMDFNGRLFAANLHRKTFLLTRVTKDMKINAKTSPSKLGYASVTLKLPSGFDLLVGGAPTGNGMLGEVLIFRSTDRTRHLKTIPSPTTQIGSYFGSSLAIADVNGDGHEDLLVGAPFFAVHANEGAVYLYLNTGKDNIDLFRPPVSVYGDSKRGSRFGTAIANAGDLNLDGFEDVAIGAPYEDKGAVYIYSGGRHGLRKLYTQKILPSSFGFLGLSLKTFGGSLSAGVDMDDNQYPDLAIGSFMSDKVVYLRSKPVASIKSSIILEFTQIRQESRNQTCIGPDGKRHICLTARISFQVGGKGVPLPAGISYTFFVDEQLPFEKRAFFLNGSERTFRTHMNIKVMNQIVIQHKVYLVMKPRNIYSPLVFKVNFNYLPEPDCRKTQSICPMMKPGSTEAMASYTKGCGSDLICWADLSVTANIIIPNDEKEVLVGVTQTLSLELSMKNSGEHAYLSKALVFCPSQLSVIGVHSDTDGNLKWSLTYKNSTHNMLEFNTGNPIGHNEVETYEISFTVETIAASLKRLVFGIEALTGSNDANSTNDKMIVFVNASVVADMAISGVSEPEFVTYNMSRKEKEVGPSITHSFLIQNKGPSTVESSKVVINFPEKYKNHYLLNIMSASVAGPVSCQIDPLVFNSLGLKRAPASRNRQKREADQMLDCTTGECQVFQCEIGRLERGESATIVLESTLVDSTFAKNVKKSSLIVVTAEIRPHLILQPSLHFPDRVELRVRVLSPKDNFGNTRQKTVPWWIILVSVIAGLVLVAGIVFVFYKGGFFNRKKRDYSFAAVPTST
eukprot:gene3301-3784_t